MNKIFNFHVVDNAAWFEKIIRLLQSRFTFISVKELDAFYNGEKSLRNTCHLTIDDGDISFYNTIYPILKKHQVPATLFVSPKVCREKLNFWFQEIAGYEEVKLKKVLEDIISLPPGVLSGYRSEWIFKMLSSAQMHEVIRRYQQVYKVNKKPFQNITVKQLLEIHASGLITIGAHTMNHPILMNESNEACAWEIQSSVSELSDILDEPVRYFAYPNGIPGMDFNEREFQFLRECGVKMAFSTVSQRFRRRDEQLSIPRIGVSNEENEQLFKAKLLVGDSWETLKKLKGKGEHRVRRNLQRVMAGPLAAG